MGIKYQELHKQNKTVCYVCKEIKDFKECVPEKNKNKSVTGYRNMCLVCNRKHSNKYYYELKQKPNKYKKRLRAGRKHYYRSKEYLSTLPIDKLIVRWCKKNIGRCKTYSGRKKAVKLLQSREKIPLEFLIQLAYAAIKKYPYIDFRPNQGTSLNRPSLDRIDSSKDYSDLSNLEIIPLWLNSAKLKASYEELNKNILHYIQIHDLVGKNNDTKTN